MAITLEAKNYRVLRQIDWSPSGVCAVVGPNGSGKTTLLSLFEFLRTAYRRGLPAAVDAQGGAWGLRHFQAPPDDAVAVSVTVDDLRWSLQLALRGPSVDPRPGEVVSHVPAGAGTDHLLKRAPFVFDVESNLPAPGAGYSTNNERLALRVVYDSTQAADLRRLIAAVEGFRFYRNCNIVGLRRNGSLHGSDLSLSEAGENAFTVLRNWHGSRDHKPKYEFVLQGLRSAFPEICQDMDFESAGQTNSVRVFPPGSDMGIPVFFAPDGWVIALLHLCAVASGQPGSLVAIDEVENSLHPHAIRQLIEAFREWAGEHDLTVCLATHSPVVLDQFKEEPENIFVMEPGRPTLPVRLTDLEDREWLAQFSLGDLYTYGDFGSPPSALPKPEPAK